MTNRLKELRTLFKLTQKEIANKIGTTYQAYAHYEKERREPDNKTLTKLADYFKVTIDFILNNDQRPIRQRSEWDKFQIYKYSEATTDQERWDLTYEYSGLQELMKNENKSIFDRYDNILPITKVKIPLLGEIACGEPIFADEDKESYIIAGTDIKADFCLICKGDSMINARINNGDIVFIRKQEMVNNGEIAAVIIDDSVTLKRVYYYPEQSKLILQAENPKYAPFVYVDEELNSIRILGKAIAFQSNI